MTAILVSDPVERIATSGFKQPFTIERLCAAIGPNLGGNTPDPTWFEGWDVVAAVRRTRVGQVHMPTFALLRRRTDGVLRIVASDHIVHGDEIGADLIAGPLHIAWAIEAAAEAVDDDEESLRAYRTLAGILSNAERSESDEYPNLLKERMRDENLADQPVLRMIAPAIRDLADHVSRLRLADRRAQAERLVESLESLLRTRD